MTPRLKTELWVDAFLRQALVSGKFGAVIHKGAEEAGSVLVVVNHLDGKYDLLEPPPGPSYSEDGTRRFINTADQSQDWADVSERIGRKRKSDPDIWVVEVEDRDGYGGAEIASN